MILTRLLLPKKKDETIRFAVNGTSSELDLNIKNVKEFHHVRDAIADSKVESALQSSWQGTA